MKNLRHIVIIRDDLPVGTRLAYTVHASGESVASRVPGGTRAIFLAARDEGHLRELAAALERESIEHTAIVEDGQMYSIGIKPMQLTSSVEGVTRPLELAG